MSLLRLLAVSAAALVCAAVAAAQPGPRPVFLPPAPLVPPALGTPSNPIVPRPLGFHVAPYGGLGYGPLGDRTGYSGSIYSNFYGSYRTPPVIPPIVLGSRPDMTLRPGPLPRIDELFPAAPVGVPGVPRMAEPTPPPMVPPEPPGQPK